MAVVAVAAPTALCVVACSMIYQVLVQDWVFFFEKLHHLAHGTAYIQWVAGKLRLAMPHFFSTTYQCHYVRSPTSL